MAPLEHKVMAPIGLQRLRFLPNRTSALPHYKFLVSGLTPNCLLLGCWALVEKAFLTAFHYVLLAMKDKLHDAVKPFIILAVLRQSV